MPDVPPTDDTLLNWVLYTMLGLLGGATTIIGTLWKLGETKNAKSIVDLEQRLARTENMHDVHQKSLLECEKDRAFLKAECEYMKRRLDKLDPPSQAQFH